MKSSCRIAFACLLLIAGCHDGAPQNGLSTTEMKIGDRAFTLEIANTESTRRTGLMKRDAMDDDHGMIFVFGEENERSFWMSNTRIPLDILYVDASGKIVSIHSMKPYDLGSTPSNGPAKYAIELNKGLAAAAGVKPGDTLIIPSEVRDPAP
jgi:uncharacterized membrane protein (UPF0127 family)